MNIDYLLGYLLGMASFLLSGEAVLRAVRQIGNEDLPNQLLDNGSLLEAYKRGNLSAQEVIQELSKEGIATDKAQTLMLLTETILGAGDNIVGLYRGTVSTEVFNNNMKRLGFTPATITTMTNNFETRLQSGDLLEAEHRGLTLPPAVGTTEKELYASGLTADRVDLLRQLALKIPQLQDLFTFAAWNTSDDSFAQRYGLDSKMPPDFMQRAKAAGLTPDLAKTFWRAHWQSVPIFILKELYQTGQIPQADLQALLDVYQIPPGMQPSIMAAFSKQLSEAQIQEAVQNGSLSETQLDQALTKIGYDSAAIPTVHKIIMGKAGLPSAEAKYAAEQQKLQYKSLSTGDVITAYVDGIIASDEVKTLMTDLGVQPDIITFQLNLANFKIKKQALNDNITAIGDDFMTGVIDQATALGQLAALGVSSTKQTNLMYKWQKIVPVKSKLPTKAELTAMIKNAVIDIPTYQTRMQQLGYSLNDITLYIAMLNKSSVAAADILIAQSNGTQTPGA